MGFCKRFTGVVLAAGAVFGLITSAGAVNTNYTSNRSPLAQTPYVPLPLGSIQAKGWLRTQLELQKTGLTGNAESVYPELGSNSRWLGGSAPDSDWERPTYYLRGFIPLAYSLNDADLKAKAQKWVEWAIASQQENGYFGPASNTDWWAHMPMLIALEDYYDATNDPRIITLLQKYFQYQAANVPSGGLGYWGAARAGDNILAVQWLYNRTGDASLLTFMDKLRTLTEDWTTALTSGSFGDNHGVNVAEGFKMPPVWYLRSLDAKDRDAFMAGINNGARLHGQAHDALSCTEFMAGKSSLQGPELCSIVDRIYSDGVALTILGDPKIGDVTEKMAFNALAGCVSRTMRQHQYYVLPNQAQSVYGAKGIYGQDYENGVCPSWISGVPCCCFNWHMGWPKFTQYSWAATSDNGLAIFTYAPAEVTAKVSNGMTVKFVEDTNYPFEEQIRLTLTAEEPVQFPLELRIPDWCANPSVKVNGVAQPGVTAKSFYKINRMWSNGDTVVLDFPMTLRASTQFNNSLAVERGPLVYSLKIGESWSKRQNKTANNLDFSEYEVKPTTAWNYGLIIDRNNPDAYLTVNKRPMPANPFLANDTPITITARAKRLPVWTMAANGLPNEVPVGPIASDAPEESITLVPFGAENLRITYFPEAMEPGFAGGLTGQYYSDKNLSAIAFTRIDPEVNFDWGASSPDPGLAKDKFSVRWTGQVRPRVSGAYTFYVTSDDGRRLWVDGQQIVNNWVNGSGTYSGTINLTAGRWYSIKLEYYEDTYAGKVTLEWESAGQPREILPPTCTRPMSSADLDLWYGFDEATGTIAQDLSGAERDGTLVNGPKRVMGKIGNALSFDGMDDYVASPYSANLASMTVMAWVKVDSLRNAKNAIYHSNGWQAGLTALTVADSGEVVFSICGMPQEDQSSVFKFDNGTFGKWKHVAVVYDGATSTARFYIDGVLDSVRTFAGSIVPVLSNNRIGGWDGGGRSFDGTIDEFRVYSRMLSDADIFALGDTGEARGLRGQYFNNSDLTGMVLVRTDANIDFNWAAGSPSTSVGADTFSVRWTGKVRPRYSETYTFYTTTDDGVRLWVNGELIIDGWAAVSSAVRSGTITLAANKDYDIRMEYFENTGNAAAKLEWSSESQAREVIPAGRIFAPEDCPEASVAWYKFDEASGATALDSTGNGKNATLTGSYTRVAGRLEKAVNLNPSTGYVNLPANIMQSCNDFTISTWVKLDTNGYWARIFDIGSGTDKYMFLCLRQGTGIRYAIKLAGAGEQICDCPVALPNGVWKHVAVTQIGNTLTIYIDGAPVAKSTGITAKPSGLGTTTQNWIGRSQYGADPYLDGQVDDFRIYSWGLTQIEVMAMAAGRPDNCISYIKKSGAIGNQALLINKVVTWAGQGVFYVQCPEFSHKACGIKVESAIPQSVGAMVNVSGTLAKDINDELMISASAVTPGISKDMPEALGAKNRDVGGGSKGIAAGPSNGSGINMVGCQQTSWGRASSVVPGVSMLVFDGSTTPNKTQCPITVLGPTGDAVNGDYVRVTGVSSIKKSGTTRTRVLLTRSAEDVSVLSHPGN